MTAIQMEILSPEEGAIRLAEIKQVIKDNASKQTIDMMDANGNPINLVDASGNPIVAPPGLSTIQLEQNMINFINNTVQATVLASMQTYAASVQDAESKIQAMKSEVGIQI